MARYQELHWFKKAYERDPERTKALYDEYQVKIMYYEDYVKRLRAIAKGEGYDY